MDSAKVPSSSSASANPGTKMRRRGGGLAALLVVGLFRAILTDPDAKLSSLLMKKK